MSITAFSFGEWLPDLPDLGNPGLTEALNVLPVTGGYEPYFPFSASGATLASTPMGALRVYVTGSNYLVAGSSAGVLFASLDNGASWSTIPATGTTISAVTAPWQFVQTLGYVMAVQNSNVLHYGTALSLSSFTPIPSAPVASELGVVGEFVVLGGLLGVSGGACAVQWGPIGDPTAVWPTPSSATAIATQSGRQFLHDEDGGVTGIHGADQFAVILQQSAVTRMTYVGPPAVFQFDRIATGVGSIYSECSVKYGNIVYFVSREGIYSTDGVTLQLLGEKRLSRYFSGLLNTNSQNIRTGIDTRKKLIYWGVAASPAAFAGGYLDHLVIYSINENRFTHAADTLLCFVDSGPIGYLTGIDHGLQAFNTTNRLGYFNGTPGTAIIASGEVEPQPGGCALINGIKAVIASSGTPPTIGVQVGSRDDQGTAVSYSSTTTPTTRTGFADFRSDARYHRARVYIAGNFDKAQGLEIDATPTGGM